ncbi:MAG: carboxypeptidase regulatory-like domain-containing protein [Acidobacteriales bacterium]|nr:carboxypeptidase regulatory-like domain-containing protein [Candidatus Koribacter versatilis]MBI3646795.1 carboxypeptidase regulatory-like domain-containing protein [Terriglobales bacterium]
MRTKQMLVALLTLLVCPCLLFAGTVSGKVSYTGTPAKPKPIDMSKEPSCAKQHATPITTETVVAGANNALANVVVYISAGAPDEGQVPQQAVTFEQKGCQYIPHVLVMHTGQELKVLNSDQTSHNIHPLAKTNREWNKSQPPGTPPISEKYDKEEFITVKCNVHPWMRGYFAVLKTSHYDVSKDDGGFKLPNLPPGKYTITAWHEDYGTQTSDVTITGNETKDVTFTFKAKAY